MDAMSHPTELAMKQMDSIESRPYSWFKVTNVSMRGYKDGSWINSRKFLLRMRRCALNNTFLRTGPAEENLARKVGYKVTSVWERDHRFWVRFR